MGVNEFSRPAAEPCGGLGRNPLSTKGNTHSPSGPPAYPSQGITPRANAGKGQDFVPTGNWRLDPAGAHRDQLPPATTPAARMSKFRAISTS